MIREIRVTDATNAVSTDIARQYLVKSGWTFDSGRYGAEFFSQPSLPRSTAKRIPYFKPSKELRDLVNRNGDMVPAVSSPRSEGMVVLLPTETTLGDYRVRMAELISDLAMYESRGENEVVRDITHPRRVGTRLRGPAPESKGRKTLTSQQPGR